MSDKQLKMFWSGISISDVISYIDEHPKEYEQFVNEEKRRRNKMKFIKLSNQKDKWLHSILDSI